MLVIAEREEAGADCFNCSVPAGMICPGSGAEKLRKAKAAEACPYPPVICSIDREKRQKNAKVVLHSR